MARAASEPNGEVATPTRVSPTTTMRMTAQEDDAMTTKNLAPLALAAALALSAGAAFVPAGAAAQGYDRGGGRNDQEIERYGRQQFERGYRIGRMEERERAMRSGRDDAGPGGMSSGMSSGQSGGQSGGGRDAVLLLDPHGHALLLVERGRQEQAASQAAQSMQEAREALQQGDRQRAEQALSRAERTLQQAGGATQAQQQRQDVTQRLNEAERALQRDDAQAARQALQQARDALRSTGQGGQGQDQQGGGQQSGTQQGGQQSGTQQGGTGGAQPPQSGAGGGQRSQGTTPGAGPTQGSTRTQ